MEQPAAAAINTAMAEKQDRLFGHSDQIAAPKKAQLAGPGVARALGPHLYKRFARAKTAVEKALVEAAAAARRSETSA